MLKEYIERREGSFYLIGSRVPLAASYTSSRMEPRRRRSDLTIRR